MSNSSKSKSVSGYVIAAVLTAFFLMIGLITAPQLIVLAIVAGTVIVVAVKCIGPILAWLIEVLFVLIGGAVILGLMVLFGLSPIVLFFAIVIFCIWAVSKS